MTDEVFLGTRAAVSQRPVSCLIGVTVQPLCMQITALMLDNRITPGRSLKLCRQDCDIRQMAGGGDALENGPHGN